MKPSTTINNTANGTNHAKSRVITKQPSILFSLESFSMHNKTEIDDKKNDENGDRKNRNLPPPLMSCIYTGMIYIICLVICEQIGRLIFHALDEYYDVLPPVLSATKATTSHNHHNDKKNQYILVRHLFVDTLSCIICATLGWYSRHESFYPIMNGTITTSTTVANNSKSGAGSTTANSHEHRLSTYMPNGFRLSLFFFSYQIKNLYDTIVWNDGPIYIFHHIFSLITAYGAMTMTCGHVYTIFFFGISEISTAILCVLANFDDEFGIVGLGEAFPLTKVICGALFVILFILCRCILWPIHSYYFCHDILSALRQDPPGTKHHRSTQTRRYWMIFFLTSLSGLSILQILWLGQIFILGQQELQKLGFI